MVSKEIFSELVKNGYSEAESGKVWDIANMSFLYSTREMAKRFLELKNHPRYKATIIDIELMLLKENISSFLESFSNQKFNLIDMGCSDGTKAKEIIRILNNHKLRYCPVSVNEYFVKLALENVKKEGFKNVVDYAPRVSPDFFSLEQIGIALRNSEYQKNVILFLGSLLGGFEINHCLFRLSQSMLPEDLLIIGNGVRFGERFVNLDNYKNRLFNEWFIHLLKELGFNENEVEYDARFANNRLEGFYRIRVDKEIQSGRNKVQFKKGDEIIVAVLYKYYSNELEDFCKMYFTNVKLALDRENEYALVLCRK